MKIVCVILFLLRRVFGVSIADADGTNFEDTFKRFESALWRRDRGSRQCGAMGLPTGNCIFAKYDNIKYVSNPDAEGLSPESNEMIISMRNDCSDNSCCDDSTICTSYTSGMMTSKQSYGYGSFQFLLKIESETKDYEIYSSSFKSAHCMSSPNPEDYPYIFKKASGVGYCENHNANLARFSSNRDLCNGRKRDICARFRWKISNVNPTTLRWKNRGYNQIDYVSSAIFVDGTLFAHGGRKLMQEFDVTLKAGQKHTIDVYAFEDCCAGNNNEGYFGWDIEKISRQDSREELMDSYGHGGSTRGGKQRLLPRSLPSSTSKAGASDKGSSSDSTIFRAEKRRKRARDNPEASTTTTQMTTTPPIDEVPGAHTTAEAHTTSESRTLPESEVTYRTSSPTGDPTTSPTGMPLTSIHSAAPSLAGWVATVSTTASTTEEVEQSTINEFTTDLAEYYGVDEEDISVTATYSATGSMQVTIPSDVTEDEMVDAITSSIANSLGVHPSDVDVIVDMETGAVEFSVTSDSFGEASDNQFDLDSANFQNGIIDAIETAVPDASVDQFEVADDINATLEFTIDADEATNDLTQAAWQSEQLLSSFGDVDVETVYRTGAPSLRPSVTPTTSLLTAAPSITEKLPVPRSTLTGPRASKSPPIQSETKPREPSPDFFPGRITPNAGSPAEGPLLDPPKRAKGSWNTGPAVETFDNLKTLMDENEHLKNMLNAERAKVVELQNSGGCSTEPCEYDSQNYSEIGTASDSSLGSAHDDQHEAAAVEDPPSQNAPASSAGSPVISPDSTNPFPPESPTPDQDPSNPFSEPSDVPNDDDQHPSNPFSKPTNLFDVPDDDPPDSWEEYATYPPSALPVIFPDVPHHEPFETLDSFDDHLVHPPHGLLGPSPPPTHYFPFSPFPTPERQTNPFENEDDNPFDESPSYFDNPAQPGPSNLPPIETILRRNSTFDDLFRPPKHPRNPFDSPTKPPRPSNPFDLPSITNPGAASFTTKKPLISSPLAKPPNPFDLTTSIPYDRFGSPTRPPRPSNPFDLPSITDPGVASFTTKKPKKPSISSAPFGILRPLARPPLPFNPFDLPSTTSTPYDRFGSSTTPPGHSNPFDLPSSTNPGAPIETITTKKPLILRPPPPTNPFDPTPISEPGPSNSITTTKPYDRFKDSPQGPRPSNPFDLPSITDPGSPYNSYDRTTKKPLRPLKRPPLPSNPFDVSSTTSPKSRDFVFTPITPDIVNKTTSLRPFNLFYLRPAKLNETTKPPRNRFDSPARDRPSNPFALPSITRPGSIDSLDKLVSENPSTSPSAAAQPSTSPSAAAQPEMLSNPFDLPSITRPGSVDFLDKLVSESPSAFPSTSTTTKPLRNPFDSPTKPPRSNPFNLPTILNSDSPVWYRGESAATDSNQGHPSEAEGRTTHTNKGDTSTIGLAGSVGSPATADGTMDLQPTPGGSDADASDNDCSECCSSEAIPDPKPCCAQVKCAEHWFRTPESSPNAVAEGLGLNLPRKSQEHAKQPRPPQSPNLGPWSEFEGSAPSVPDSERNMGPWTEFEESSVPESPFLGPVPESADVFSEFEDHDCQGDECSRRKSTTEEAYYTTKEAKPSSTTEGPDGTPDPTVEPSDIAVICVSLQRMFIAFGEIGLAKISMCIMSCQSRQAVLIASLGRDMYKETVDLPFDAASRVGRYSIDWLPNKIVWKVDKMSLRTVGHNLAPIPDKAMHIKLYVVPENPSTIDQNSMVEHKLHLFSAKYEKFSNEKTELFVLGGGKNTLLRFITFASGLVVLATLVIHHFWFTNKEEEFPTGYMMLQAGELTEDI